MKVIKKILTILGIILFVLILTVCIIILYKSYSEPDKVPSIFGWKPFIVLSGSMETNIMTGDLIFVKELDTSELKIGDIIAFRTDKDFVVTHRIVDIIDEDGETKYYTKGDNNNAQDADAVSPTQVEGIYMHRIPKLGSLAVNLQKPVGMVVCITLPLIILVIAQFTDSKRQEKLVKEKEKMQKNLEEEMKMLKQKNEELMKNK